MIVDINAVRKELRALTAKRSEIESSYQDKVREVIALNTRIDKLQELKDCMLAVCEHDWVEDGTTNHGRVQWFKCIKCGTSK